MMNDHEKLEKIRTELMNSEENSHQRMKKENVLEKLLIASDNKTGELMSLLIIPKYEHDGEFLKEILAGLGYTPSYEEEYNDFYQRMCYKVIL